MYQAQGICGKLPRKNMIFHVGGNQIASYQTTIGLSSAGRMISVEL
jgi:hypothetical protein